MKNFLIAVIVMGLNVFSRYHKKRGENRDTNEPDILKAIPANAHYQEMPGIVGYDFPVFYEGKCHIIEVKNPSKLRKKGHYWENVIYMLTDNESKTKAKIEAAGGVYNIVFYPNDLRVILGLPIVKGEDISPHYNKLGDSIYVKATPKSQVCRHCQQVFDANLTGHHIPQLEDLPGDWYGENGIPKRFVDDSKMHWFCGAGCELDHWIKVLS